jgi:hypothetical protein
VAVRRRSGWAGAERFGVSQGSSRPLMVRPSRSEQWPGRALVWMSEKGGKPPTNATRVSARFAPVSVIYPQFHRFHKRAA